MESTNLADDMPKEIYDRLHAELEELYAEKCALGTKVPPLTGTVYGPDGPIVIMKLLLEERKTLIDHPGKHLDENFQEYVIFVARMNAEPWEFTQNLRSFVEETPEAEAVVLRMEKVGRKLFAYHYSRREFLEWPDDVIMHDGWSLSTGYLLLSKS